MKYLVTIGLVAVLVACGTTKKLFQKEVEIKHDSIYFNKDVVIRDTTLVTKAEKLLIIDTIPCPEADYSRIEKSGTVTAKVAIKKGRLSVECKTDSLLNRIQWLETTIEKSRSLASVKTEKKEIVKYKTPLWCYGLIAVCIGLVAFQFKGQILKLILKKV